MSLIHRVIAGFAVVILLVLGISVSAYVSQVKMADQLKLTSSTLTELLDGSNTLLLDLENINRITLFHANENDQAQRQKLAEEFRAAVNQYRSNRDKLAKRLQGYPELSQQLGIVDREASVLIQGAEQHLHIQDQRIEAKNASTVELAQFESGWKNLEQDLTALNSEAEWNNLELVVIDLDIAEAKGKSVENLLQKALLVENDQAIQSLTKQVKEHLAIFSEKLTAVLKEMPDSKKTLQRYVDLLTRTVVLPEGLMSQHLQALALQRQSSAKLARLSQQVDKIIKDAGEITSQVRQMSSDARAEAEQQASYSMITNVVLSLISIIVAVVVAGTVVYAIKRPLNVITKALSELANGNLAWTIKEEFRSEMGIVVKDINKLGKQLHHLIGSVKQSANTLTQVAGDSYSMSDKTHRDLALQRKQTDSIATAITEMESAVDEVAHHASDASNEVEKVTELANSNIANMQNNLAFISSLKTSLDDASGLIHQLSSETQEIGHFIEVIQNISEQTNLLALNAAIEAARAGENGRGFAVVADEVRALATNSRRSADEISQKIDGLQKMAQQAVGIMESNLSNADKSVSQTEKTHTSLRAMIARLSTINEMSRSIATACEQQSVVAKEVAVNIVTISDMASSITEDSETLAHNSESLNTLAAEQSQLVARFTL
ncbi:methyl-accepting chemotaxis protein [Vibrio tritonius]|uniref:methyl-accepting chemotaxis protein n=1 Tax=Vibrio tritonius TaxID=1435069 RepID=UPI00315D9D56